MKKINLKNMTSNIIKEHLADGWTLDWDDTSRGCQACYILLKGDKVRFVYVTWETFLYDKEERIDNAVEIGICEDHIENRDRCGIWRESEKDIFRKTYYRIGEKRNNEWYTDDKEEAIAAGKKRIERYRTSENREEPQTLEATDAFVETMRKVPGFEKASKKNLRIKKIKKYCAFQGNRFGYQVDMLNRVGNVKESRFYQLG